jgi:O-antigen biosynthesis protein
MKEDLTIVITTKNGFFFTRYCIESITWTLPRGSYELIVVDNGSTDETCNLRELDGIRLIENGGTSLYSSWNMGIEAARNEFVMVLNNDIVFLTPNWWQWLRRGLVDHGFDWVFPLSIESQRPIFGARERIEQSSALDALVAEHRPGWFEACAFAIHKRILDDVGSFDDTFDIWYGEKDYEIRLLAAGRKYAAVQNVVVRHFGSSTLRVGFENQSTFDRGFAEDIPSLNLRAREDYEKFQHKWSDSQLAPLGLRMPEFGRRPLAVQDPSQRCVQ